MGLSGLEKTVTPCRRERRLWSNKRAMFRRFLVAAFCAVCACGLAAQRGAQSGSQQPARDTPSQNDAPPAPSGRIAGKVVAADTGRPVKRARAFVSAPELPAGTAQTDDRGEYRVWGLNPGEYYVSALARNFDFGQARGALAAAFGGRGGPGGGGQGGGGQGGGGRGGRGGGRGGFLDFLPADDETQKAYAPTFYPGVGSVNEALAITIGIGGEKLGVNFNLLLVRTARVSGSVANAD